MTGCMDDLMQRYSPPVEPHRYKVKFIPVVDCDSTEEQRQKICQRGVG